MLVCMPGPLLLPCCSLGRTTGQCCLLGPAAGCSELSFTSRTGEGGMAVELWILALTALLLLLLCFSQADADFTLLWAEWQGRRPERELTDMVVWVTGASSGIGEELAVQLSKLRVSLVLSARRVQELERVKRRCLENGNLKEKDVLVLPLDLRDRSSHEVATKAVLEEFGKIDILVNNGGRAQTSLALDTNLDVFKEVMELNYLGTVSLTKCVLPHMMERKQGKIVTVNSIAGILSLPNCSGYCASKHALRGFFNSLHAELVHYPGITLCNVCPGPVESDILKNALTEELNKSVDDPEYKYQTMATSRCVRLMLISMANDLKEVWISEQPALLQTYMWQYMPTWGMWLTCKLSRISVPNFQHVLDIDSYFKLWKRKHD